jgi:molecular chaperone Hsp31 and glyoxalase 3
MIKKILGIAPKLEDDGSYSPSKVALRLAVSAKTDFVQVSYEKYQGPKF